MAGMKQLSAGSSQILMMMFRDKNNAPIKADTVHVKGSIFTKSGKPFEFEVNKGVCTNCKIQNDMLLFNIVPLLGLGQMQVYTQTYLDDAKSITGTYVSENQQRLEVEVVNKGTFLSDRQGAMWVDVYLPIEINTDAQIPWVPAGADEQWIKDYLDKYVQTPEFAQFLATNAVANKSLSNVDAKDFENKGKEANFAQNDLADVDLGKLKEKGLAAGLADGKNPITATEFDRMIKQNAAFIALSKTAHPATAGKTNEQIKALFYANRQEVQSGVNLNTDPYNKSTTLFLSYQMANGQTIQQTLPPVSDNRIIFLELIQQSRAANYKVVLSPAGTDKINGVSNPVTVTGNGFAGVLFPVQNELTWQFMPWFKLMDSNLSASDDRGNVVLQVKNLKFKSPFYIEYDDNTEETRINIGNVPMMFVDGILNKNFKAPIIKSLDKSIRISMIPDGQDGEGNDLFFADFSVASKPSEQGIYAEVGWDTVWNSKFPKSRINYGNVLVAGGDTVRVDNNTKSFNLGDISDTDDPSVTGGTSFLVAMGYKPNKTVRSTITQNGYLRAELTDNTGAPILDLYGNPIAMQNDYNDGDTERPMFYIGICKVAADTLVHVQFSTNFVTEELITVGADTFVMFQAISKDGGLGDAYNTFVERTGIRIETDKKYYGTNFINLAQMLTQTLYVNEYPAEYNNFGLNAFLSAKTAYKFGIENNELIIQGDNRVPPIVSMGWIYTGIDGHLLKGKELKVTAKMENQACAVEFAVLEYMGNKADYTKPELIGFTGDDAEFSAGWVPMSKFSVPLDPTQGVQTHTGVLTLPTNSETFAVVVYPVNPAIGMTLKLKDIEADVTPEHTHVIITDNSNAINNYLEYKLASVSFETKTPTGLAGLRYSAQAADTKVPVGVINGKMGLFFNNHAWTDQDTGDASAEGDLEAIKDLKVLTAKYQVRKVFNEGNTDSKVEFWLAKVNSDGSFTEIPGSRITDTIEAKRVVPKVFFSNAFSFVANKADSFRVFMKSDKNDGFYLQSGTDGIPLFSLAMEVSEIEEVPRLTDFSGIELMDGDTEVKDPENYTIQIDVKTGAVSIKKK